MTHAPEHHAVNEVEVVPVDPDGEIVLYVGDGDVPEEQVRGVIVAHSRNIHDVGERLRQVADISQRIGRIGDRLQLDFDEVLTAIERFTEDHVPLHPRSAEMQFSAESAAVLAEAGLGPLDTVDRPRASARAALRYGQLVANSLTVAQAAQRLGVSEPRIRQRLAARTLYGFHGSRGWHLPEFQFSGDSAIPGIDHVIAALPEKLRPLAVEGFFVRPNVDLELDGEVTSVVEWLAAGGDPELPAQLARDLLTSL